MVPHSCWFFFVLQVYQPDGCHSGINRPPPLSPRQASLCWRNAAASHAPSCSLDPVWGAPFRADTGTTHQNDHNTQVNISPLWSMDRVCRPKFKRIRIAKDVVGHVIFKPEPKFVMLRLCFCPSPASVPKLLLLIITSEPTSSDSDFPKGTAPHSVYISCLPTGQCTKERDTTSGGNNVVVMTEVVVKT